MTTSGTVELFDVSKFYGEVLEKLRAGFAARGDTQRARLLTRRLMGQVGARMLILDEIKNRPGLSCLVRFLF